MKFTEQEKRFLHKEHASLRMPKLLTVEEFVGIGCPLRSAEITVERELEKRARQLGPALAAIRKYAPEPAIGNAVAVSIEEKIAVNSF